MGLPRTSTALRYSSSTHGGRASSTTVLVNSLAPRNGNARPHGDNAEAVVNHFIFLIHPFCNELPPGAAGCDGDDDGSALLFQRRERVVSHRWVSALERSPAGALLVLQGGPQFFESTGAPLLPQGFDRVAAVASARLVARRVFRPTTRFDASPSAAGTLDEQLRGYFQQLGVALERHLATYGLTYDRRSASSEAWGESFEGCVPGYGGIGVSCWGYMYGSHRAFGSR
eukprot:COSAG06_NODE_2281_length_7180_cov_49.556701_4_plen_228_part_00